MLSTMIFGQLEEAKNQYENRLQTQPKPYLLNDEEILTPKIGVDLNRSQLQLQELSKVITNILSLAYELKSGTIEKAMKKK
ncbi:hypothetical protein G9F72_007370 [Clostridium estertheticum]|uniref:hypothetical protein n=1 Tax=Clostridium estertheticum TaxID=238834 RepID=UPI001CD052FC|nr:hypothetical protein [Clostridium estertheticum]MBZ9686150.1 hypothetical protein [Clostridium estertheticum]